MERDMKKAHAKVKIGMKEVEGAFKQVGEELELEVREVGYKWKNDEQKRRDEFKDSKDFKVTKRPRFEPSTVQVAANEENIASSFDMGN